MLYLASDHAGFVLKEEIKSVLKKTVIPCEDLGCNSKEPCDYPDFAHPLAQKILESGGMGIAICGTGIGISIALNRHPGIRAALCHTEEAVLLARKHADANILVLAGREICLEQTLRFLGIFLETEFEGGRHLRRVEKIERSVK